MDRTHQKGAWSFMWTLPDGDIFDPKFQPKRNSTPRDPGFIEKQRCDAILSFFRAVDHSEVLVPSGKERKKKKKKAMKTKTENETMMISLPLGLRCVSHPPQSAWTFLLYWKACTICTLACFPCDIPAHEPDLNDDSHMYYYNRCIVRVRPSVTPFLCALESARLMFAFLRSGFA